ncbi:MAG: putative Universal stress protein UspA [Nitrospira sp.]
MNVLVAMDGSQYGRQALSWAAALPLKDKPRITALHVLDIAALRAPFVSQSMVAGNERFIQQEIRRMERRSAETLAGARRQMRVLRLNGKAKELRGGVAPTILKQAQSTHGMIIVGSQGLDALDRLMLGSISTNVLHHASCPVLIAKTHVKSVRRIVLAADGSPSSRQAMKWLLTKFRPTVSTRDAREPIHVTVVHVMPFLKYPELKEAGSRLAEEYRRKLADAGFAADAVCRLGRPADEIVKVATERRADLIVMGAQGLGAIARFVLGSVSTRVAQRSSASVLVTR